jgi:D-sedoheptulose 7-phosphate isomerase
MPSLEKMINKQIAESIAVKTRLLESPTIKNEISDVARIIIAAYTNGNKVMFAGNGGSAADAQHLAAEFVSRFEFDRPGLPSIALSTDTSMLTAIGNDYGYENLFKRQLEAQSKPGDIFIGITTSGTSKNVVAAFDVCADLDVISVALCGLGGTLEERANKVIRVPSKNTARIQECHILIGHILCGAAEQSIFYDYNPRNHG